MKKIGCVIMAAGKSVRFGGNKLDAEFEGRPMFLHAFEAIPDGLFARVVVVTQYAQIMDCAARYGFQVLCNDQPEAGLSRTVAMGTQALEDCDAILFLVADQPLLRRATVERIVHCWLAHPESITGASHHGKRGNPCIFPREFFPELKAITGDRGGNTVIRAHEDRLRTVEVAESELTDVDTRQVLSTLEQECTRPTPPFPEQNPSSE